MRAAITFVAPPLAVIHNFLVCGVAAEMPGRRILSPFGTRASADSVRGHVYILVSADARPKSVAVDTFCRDRVDRRDRVPSDGKLNQRFAWKVAPLSLSCTMSEIHRARHRQLNFPLVEQAGYADRQALAAVGHHHAHREVIVAPAFPHQCLDVIEHAFVQHLGRALP